MEILFSEPFFQIQNTSFFYEREFPPITIAIMSEDEDATEDLLVDWEFIEIVDEQRLFLQLDWTDPRFVSVYEQ